MDQQTVDAEFDAHDILTNRRRYPIDESPAACKDFKEVLRRVESRRSRQTRGDAEGAVRDQRRGQGR